MATTITAGNATNGAAISSDNTGILELKTGTGSGTTGLTIDASQNVTLPNAITLTGGVAGDFKMNSGYGSVATAYGCRAWVNFNGTTNVGGFCTIRGSGNVTSVADNGTGSYTVNFTTAMPDTNYSVAKSDNFYSLGDVKTFNTTNVTVQCYQAIGSVVDTSIVCVAVFR